MKKELDIKKYWTDTANMAKSTWNRISGKTQKEMAETIREMTEKASGLEIDVESLKIKLASTEIDLKASEIEKETLQMQLEEKKMQLVDLKLKINQIESTSITSDIELNQLLKRLKVKEEETNNLKNKILDVIAMLCMMSENERYQDIVKIQTNTIDATGMENHSIYITYGGQTVEVQTKDIIEEETQETTAKSNDKIIQFDAQALYEYQEDQDLAMQAE